MALFSLLLSFRWIMWISKVLWGRKLCSSYWRSPKETWSPFWPRANLMVNIPPVNTDPPPALTGLIWSSSTCSSTNLHTNTHTQIQTHTKIYSSQIYKAVGWDFLRYLCRCFSYSAPSSPSWLCMRMEQVLEGDPWNSWKFHRLPWVSTSVRRKVFKTEALASESSGRWLCEGFQRRNHLHFMLWWIFGTVGQFMSNWIQLI